MGIVTLKSNDYFVISLKNPKKITIILLLISCPPPPKKKYRLTVPVTVPLKKVSIISLVVTVPSKKVTIKSLVVIFPYKKVSIIHYSLLFHIKSNDNFVNQYFSHTKYVSLTLIVTNPHKKYCEHLPTPLLTVSPVGVYSITLVQYLYISCYLSDNKPVLSYLLSHLLPQW